MKWLYVGEVGFGNLGDDGCAQIISNVVRDQMELKALDGISPNDIADRLIIGGGTILSLRGTVWMKRLTALAERCGQVASVGTGVDPGIPWSTKGAALARRLFATIQPANRGVRGPISKAMLAVVGVNETVVAGDPFCLYRPMPTGKDGSIGVIPGHQGRSVGGAHFHDRMISAIRKIPGKVVYIPVWSRDLGLERAYQAFSGVGDFRYVGSQLPLIAQALTRCTAVIVNRMHAGLLAMVCGTPAFFIAHHIKVCDLCLALDWPHWAPADDEDLPGKVERFCKTSISLAKPRKLIAGYGRTIEGIVNRLR